MIEMRIRALRENKDLKQKDIANILHVTQQTYSRYEIQKSRIPIEDLFILSEYYHTNIYYLVGLNENDKYIKFDVKKLKYN